MFVKPKDGRSVPDPARGDFLPVDGRNVEENQYWYRRVQDGDVAIVPPETPAEPTKKASDK